MSLLTDNGNTSTEENVTTEENVVNENVETTTETTETAESLGFLDNFKEYMGEDYNDKYENTYKKFEKDGDLDTNELFKAYRNLEKSFSEKREAPESYEVTYGEDITDDFKFTEESELLNKFTETAKELNVTQEQYNGIMNMMAGFIQSDAQAQAEAQQNAINELKNNIPDFNGRVEKINGFLQSKLDESEYNALAGAVTNESAMKAVEKLMKLNRDPSIPQPKSTPVVDRNTMQDQLNDLYKQRHELQKTNPELVSQFHKDKIIPLIQKINGE